jgi:hypothetical protein|tara:strand:+ start:173 stop:352 length:180 start_codon:yes stop_codon:yes gene_type:complete
MFFDFDPGDYVTNPNNTDWGVGQVQSIIKNIVTVNFTNAGKKTINANEIVLDKYNEKAE